MKFEVEQKYPVTDLPSLHARLAALGATPAEAQSQVDRYYAHPVRNFARTDEALRIRRIGESNFVTYKGPKLDATTKTRRELELPLAPGESGFADFAALLEVLGFTRVAEVRKQRRKAVIAWQGSEIEAALDEVEQVGSFLELELVVDEADLPLAKERLASLAAELDLKQSERRSYLEMLLIAKGELST